MDKILFNLNKDLFTFPAEEDNIFFSFPQLGEIKTRPITNSTLSNMITVCYTMLEIWTKYGFEFSTYFCLIRDF